MTSWLKYEQEHDTEFRSFSAFVMSRYPLPGSASAKTVDRLREADLPPRAVAWEVIEQHLIDQGWDEVSLSYASRIHARYMSKGHLRHKLRRSGEFRTPVARQA